MSNRQKYLPEFRTEAVQLVLEQGLNRDDAAKKEKKRRE
jgi:transposase-like protein